MKYFAKLLLIVSTIMYVCIIFWRLENLKPFLISAPMFFLLIIYFLERKKNNILIIITFLISIVANILITKDDYYLISMILFTIESILFSLILIMNSKREKYNFNSTIYVHVVFILLFVILFVTIFSGIDNKIISWVSFCYGVVSFSLCALAFLLFLNKISKLNFLLFIGFFVKIISDVLYSLSLQNEFSNLLSFSSDFFYLVSYLIIFKIFIHNSIK